jgi:hypothetical protein
MVCKRSRLLIIFILCTAGSYKYPLSGADTKRNRGASTNYDSYQLVSERKSVDSKAWTSKDQYAIPDIADPEFFEDQFNELE